MKGVPSHKPQATSPSLQGQRKSSGDWLKQDKVGVQKQLSLKVSGFGVPNGQGAYVAVPEAGFDWLLHALPEAKRG